MSCKTCNASCPAAGSSTKNKYGLVTSSSDNVPIIALLGQPNSGKSTLFNGLTGARQHVGNWPGKTVEQKTGTYQHDGKTLHVVDLPGSYSLDANSPEEEVTRDYLASGTADAVVIMADASQLERSLYIFADFAITQPNTPCMLVLNLMDVAQEQGKTINTKLIEQRIGVPVVPLVASKPKEYGKLHKAINQVLTNQATIKATSLHKNIENYSNTIQAKGRAKYSWIEQILKDAVNAPQASHTLSRFDKIMTGSRWSKPLAIGMILVGFLLAFIPAIPIMLIGGLFSSLGQVVAGVLAQAGAPDILGSFLAGVVFNSLCFGTMMVGYVFGINLVFGLFEESGYMARISYVFDHTMARFGLQGKSLMPFLMCLGCTMGGVSGSRVIDSWGQRMLTVMMAWAIPCGSTWGVVPVLAVAFFGITGAPLVIVGIFLVMLMLMWIIGRLFGPRLVSKDERAGMVMELPPYHRPHLRNVVRGATLKSRQMFVRAIRVVALFAFAIWALTYTSTGNVEGSVLYAIGTAIEPITQFFGMGWETFTAWLCALVLKESALGVLSGLFTGGSSPNAVIVGVMTGGATAVSNIGDVMAQAISAPEALAFIFAFTFNMPCAASVSATWGEVHSTKWTIISAVFYIASSLILGCIVYHVAMLLM